MAALGHIAVVAGSIISGGCCLPLGDGLFFVEGDAPQSGQCELTQESASGQRLSQLEVRGHFSEIFMADPCGATYRVTASCNGATVRSIAVKYGDGVRGGEKIQLGNLASKRLP
jgi:hypothetical protein